MQDRTLFAIVLAAGESSRFGDTKQLARYAGGTLVGNAVRVAESVCDRHSLLVAGNEWRKVTAACKPQRGFFVVNPEYRDGMSTSIRAGVRATADIADAVMLMLADQPLVTAGNLEALVAAWHAHPDSIVASAYAGTLGPPVVFPAMFFPELAALEGDRGARSVIEAHRERVVSIAVDSGAVDVDRPGDLAGL